MIKNIYTRNKEQLNASNPEKSVWVSASAGTGKTTILIDRVLRLLLNGVSIAQIICITYTKAAAQEMINRLMEQLASLSIATENEIKEYLRALTNQEPTVERIYLAKTLFASVLDHPEGIQIQTVHSLCENILKRFPIEAGIPNNFMVIENDFVLELKKQAVDTVLTKTLQQKNIEDIRKILNTIITNTEELYFQQNVYKILEYSQYLEQIITQNSWFNNKDILKNNLYSYLEANVNKKATDVLVDYFTAFPKQEWLDVCYAIENCGHTAGSKTFDTAFVQQFLKADTAWQVDNYKTWFSLFLTDKNTPRQTVLSKDIIKKINLDILLINEEQQRILLAVGEYNNQNASDLNWAFLQLVIEIYEEYQNLKHKASVMDFNDLLQKTNNLLNNLPMKAWVLYKLDQQIDHLLIDEAQDTSPLQWEIIKALCDDFFSGNSTKDYPRTIFIVGDIKQSIYSFQGADPYVFSDIKDYFNERIGGVNQEFLQIPLKTSFRSSLGILNFVNDMSATAFNVNKVPYEGEDIIHEIANKNNNKDYLVEIWPIITNTVQEVVDKHKIYKDLANNIVHKIKELHTSYGVNYGDILILYKKRQNNKSLSYLLKFLKDEGIPVTGIDRLNLTESLVIQDIIALIKFLLMPRDDFSLACVLKSPFFNLTDEDIYDLTAVKNTRGLFYELNQDKYKDIYLQINKWLSLVDYVGLFDLFFSILYQDKKITNILQRFGQDCLDPISEFMNTVYNFSKSNTESLQGFLKFITYKDQTIKRDISNKEDAVSFMTVHASKGRESRVVFLLNDLDNKNKGNPIIYNNNSENPLLLFKKKPACGVIDALEHEQKILLDEENKRLYYVAITRSKEFLFVCSIVKNIKDGDESTINNIWHKILFNTINVGNIEQFSSNMFSPENGFCSSIGYRFKQIKDVGEVVGCPLKTILIPSWVYKQASKEENPTTPLSPSRLQFEEQYFSSPLDKKDTQLSFINKGLIVHKILEQINYINGNYDVFIKKFLHHYEKSITKEDYKSIVSSVLNIVHNDEFAFLFNNSSYNEISISGKVINDITGELDVVSARIDKIVKLEINKTICIVDYKFAKYKNSIYPAYTKQMSLYKKLLMQIYPNYQIKSYILFTQDPILVEVYS